jgi:predicted membrane-bound spermidine synthase
MVRPIAGSQRVLLLVVFLAGVGTLGIEMVASRLLAPFFGTSQPIWAVVIGLTLIYLSIGYHLGGRLADRSPHAATLYKVICWGGFLAGLIPLVADPILRFSQQAFRQLLVGGFLGALLGVLLLFAAPVILLAMVSPIALRLAVRPGTDTTRLGATAGSISAISTIGSIVGTFLTALVLIPAIGTAQTTYLFAVFLVVVGILGLRDWRYLGLLLLLGITIAYTTTSRSQIKTADCRGCQLIYETESATNYIQVALRTDQRGVTMNLLLNEGQAIHSIYNPYYEVSNDPADLLTGGPWDYFAVAPYLYPNRASASVQSLLMLGSATGTTPKQFLAIYGADAVVDAVEIDPAIIAVGREFFALNDAEVADLHPNYRVYADDARYWLAQAGERQYDVIGVDAYHQPYIPFHLTTVEFFQLARQHLTPQGVLVINAGKSPTGNDILGQTLATTLLEVFPQVFVLDTVTGNNQMLVAVNQPVGNGVINFIENSARMTNPTLRTVMDWTLKRGELPPREFQPTAGLRPFTDDHAPVEQLIDGLIFDTARTITAR